MQEAKAKQSNITMPARKLRRVINEVRGKSVEEAVRILRFMPYFAARVVEKNLTAAVANASEKFGANAKDTGSAEVQIAMLTKKISELTEHMKSNKKDFATKRGLLMMVGKRKRLLSYIKDRNLDEYRDLIKKLKIRG